MFSKLSLLVLVAPLVSALTISAPTDVTSGGVFTIKWTPSSGDPPTFTLELTNPSFNNAIAIANNVDASTGSLTLQCPAVASGGAYTIQAVDNGNINNVFAETPIFSIGATISSSGSAPSSTASATGTGATTTLAGTLTSANSLPVTTAISTATTPTGTTPSTSTGTDTATSTTPSSAATSSRLALTTVGGYAVLMLSAVAGAAAVAF